MGQFNQVRPHNLRAWTPLNSDVQCPLPLDFLITEGRVLADGCPSNEFTGKIGMAPDCKKIAALRDRSEA